jgi:4-hydroxyphenylacetate 3-monooxygenase
MLGTGAVTANELLVTCIQPLRSGDERYAICFAVPMNAKGLKILSRKSYEQAATSIFDNPLASRFDENDAIIYFDDVKVPWDRVFVNQDIGMCQRQFHGTPAHVFQNYQAPRDQAALPRWHRATHRGGQRHDCFPSGQRNAGCARS